MRGLPCDAARVRTTPHEVDAAKRADTLRRLPSKHLAPCDLLITQTFKPEIFFETHQKLENLIICVNN